MAPLRFSRFGKAPEHHHAALAGTTENDFYAATGMYRLQPCPVGYEISYVPMSGGGEIVARREHLGLAGSFKNAKRTAQQHADRRAAEPQA